eukprot:symbB.v1.2.000651.t1/scaffold28.1/size414311/5
MGCGASGAKLHPVRAWEPVVASKSDCSGSWTGRTDVDGSRMMPQRVQPMDFSTGEPLDSVTAILHGLSGKGSENSHPSSSVDVFKFDVGTKSTSSPQDSVLEELHRELEVKYLERMERMPVDLNGRPEAKVEEALKELRQDLHQLDGGLLPLQIQSPSENGGTAIFPRGSEVIFCQPNLTR